jgi:RNA recognition motif-containing protein
MRQYRKRKSTMKLYVGNLSFSTTETALEDAFSAFGTVDSVNIINDRDTGRSKGFGFVEMNDDQEAQAAITGLNGKSLDNRDLRVNEARPREDRPARGGFGGGRRNSYRW